VVEQCWHQVPGGSGTYIQELTREFQQRGDARLTGFAARHSTPPVLPIAVPTTHSRLPRPVLYEAWTRLRRPGLPGVAGAADVIHATTWAIPRRTAPLVVTVHDLAFLRNPEFFTTRGNAFFRRAFDIVRDEADIVIAPSQTTADDCVAHGIEAERIRVIQHGVRSATVAGSTVDAFRLRRGLDRPYILWCGTLEPRKNVAGLIAAFVEVSQRSPDLDLVLVGPRGWGQVSEQVSAAMSEELRSRVHLLGRLDDDELAAAYAGARAFCFPSFWEGFGMPVLEAMAHGAPVVTSRDTSMAEFIGGGGLLADPGTPDQIAEALLEAVGGRHDELAEGARRAAEAFTWARTADLTVRAYRDAARG